MITIKKLCLIIKNSFYSLIALVISRKYKFLIRKEKSSRQRAEHVIVLELRIKKQLYIIKKSRTKCRERERASKRRLRSEMV